MGQVASFPLAIVVPVPRSHWDGRLAVDLLVGEDTPWLAVFDGVATPIDVPDGGHALLLRSVDGSLTAYYAHGRSTRVSGPVRAGQTIGYVSTSGNARGRPPHLHFAVGRAIDAHGASDLAPWDFLAGASPGSGGYPAVQAEASNARTWLVFGGLVLGVLLLDELL